MSELLELLVKTSLEKQGENIVSIDMTSVNPFTDYFLIMTSRNTRHADALANDLMKKALENGYQIRLKEGAEGSSWILIDLKEVVVHIFTEEGRMQYRLENLWGDLPIEHYTDEEA